MIGLLWINNETTNDVTKTSDFANLWNSHVATKELQYIISIYDINEILPLDSNYFDAMSIEAKNTFLEEFFGKISLGFCDGERQRHEER